MKYQLFLKCSGLDSEASEDETDRDSDTQSPTGAATHRRDTWKNAPIASKTGLLLSVLEYKYAQFLCSQCNVTELLALLVMCVTKPLKWMTEAYNHLWSGTCHFYCFSYIIVSPVHVAKCLAPVYLG